MATNLTTEQLEEALKVLVENMGASIVEYVGQSRKPNVKPAKDKLRENLGLLKR